MTEELKTVVTIISVLIIVGIFGHGLWSIRKNKEQLRDLKQPKRNEPDLDVKSLDVNGLNTQSDDQLPSSLNADGLDSHGVGVPRTIASTKTPTPSQSASLESAPVAQPHNQNTSHQQADDLPSFSAQAPHDHRRGLVPEQGFTAADKQNSQAQAIDTRNTATETEHTGQSSATKPSEEPSKEPSEKPSEKSHQQSTSEKSTSEASSAQPSEVLIAHVSMPQGQTISGASLLPLLISLGFKFGEMDIFHRHEDSAGHGAVLFSLASMYNPGTFDIDNIEQISTKGLSMFMTLPCKGEALANFNMMHNAAKKISEEFGAQLLDSNRSALTVQTVRHYVEKIREFERQRLING